MSLKKLSWLLIGGVICTVIIYAAALIFLTWPLKELSISNTGVFGDSFGLLTSLFSGLAFAGLIITIVMQHDELALQRQELNLTREELKGQKQEMQNQNETLNSQRFENTFFKMLEFLESTRNDIFYRVSKDKSVQGRDAIKSIFYRFINYYLRGNSGGTFGNFAPAVKEEYKTSKGIANGYSLLYEEYGDELGQYYRTLYNILKFVDRANFVEDKFIYTNLVRAQLSRYELLLLFYNCLSDYGQGKMMPLVQKYKILKHLEPSMLPRENYDLWVSFNEQLF